MSPRRVGGGCFFCGSLFFLRPFLGPFLRPLLHRLLRGRVWARIERGLLRAAAAPEQLLPHEHADRILGLGVVCLQRRPALVQAERFVHLAGARLDVNEPVHRGEVGGVRAQPLAIHALQDLEPVRVQQRLNLELLAARVAESMQPFESLDCAIGRPIIFRSFGSGNHQLAAGQPFVQPQ